MIGVLVHQHMCQQTRARAATFDRARWQWRLADRLAARTGHSGTNEPVHDEPTGDILQLLGDVLTERLEPAAALAARIAG